MHDMVCTSLHDTRLLYHMAAQFVFTENCIGQSEMPFRSDLPRLNDSQSLTASQTNVLETRESLALKIALPMIQK
jgi:hypothetical protein